jgi:hypothetical protein
MPEPIIVPPLLLRKRQAAEMLACCERTIDNLTADGVLHPVWVNGGKRYSYADLQEYVRKMQAEGDMAAGAVRRRQAASKRLAQQDKAA